jgi:hypothetical protein
LFARPQKCNECPAESRSYLDVAPFILGTLQVQVDTDKGRFPEELHEAARLMSSADKSLVLFFGNHHHRFSALPRDALWSFRSSSSKHLDEPGFRGLDLPRMSRRVPTARPVGYRETI